VSPLLDVRGLSAVLRAGDAAVRLLDRFSHTGKPVERVAIVGMIDAALRCHARTHPLARLSATP
jgi:hypothetical protein